MTQIDFSRDGSFLELHVKCRLSAVPILIEFLETTIKPIAASDCPEDLRISEAIVSLTREIKQSREIQHLEPHPHD